MRGSKCSRELLLNCKSVCCNGFLLQKAYKKHSIFFAVLHKMSTFALA